MAEELTIGQLNEKFQELTSFVEKQSKLIGQTGKQLIEFQINDVKNKMAKSDGQLAAAPVDTSDFVTNEDIIQLVGELQSQLDFLEERSIRRTFNVQLTADSDVIAPITNKDGELPEELFPRTLKDLKNLDKFQIVQLSEFYELIVPSQQQEDLQKFLQSDQINTEDAEKLLQGNNDSAGLADRVNALTPEQLDEVFDELARYLGVKFRKVKGSW